MTYEEVLIASLVWIKTKLLTVTDMPERIITMASPNEQNNSEIAIVNYEETSSIENATPLTDRGRFSFSIVVRKRRTEANPLDNMLTIIADTRTALLSEIHPDNKFDLPLVTNVNFDQMDDNKYLSFVIQFSMEGEFNRA